MARPLRVEYSGACYHVVGRGNRRNQVFSSDSDYTLFLDKLAGYVELYGAVIYTYCLMPNHYHLFLKTNHANLGKFMQALITSFTLSMNKKYGQCGHLFQGRYKAQLVETELYRNKLSRYIHLNPVKLKSLESESAADLKKLLRNYKWSGFQYYLGIAKKPDWINRSFVLASWGRTGDEKIKNYRRYVEEGVLSDNSGELSSNEISNIIGSDYFRDEIIRTYLKKGLNDIDKREQPTLARLNSLSVDDVIRVVGEYFKLEKADRVVVRKGAILDARKIAMYLAVRHCKRTDSLARIASHFRVGINGISSNTKRCDEKLLTNKMFRKQLQEIDGLLHENTKAKV